MQTRFGLQAIVCQCQFSMTQTHFCRNSLIHVYFSPGIQFPHSTLPSPPLISSITELQHCRLGFL